MGSLRCRLTVRPVLHFPLLHFLDECQPGQLPFHLLWPSLWHIVEGTAIELAPRFGFPHAAPLLEEESNLCGFALLADAMNPAGLHRAGAVAALAANDYPVNPVQLNLSEILQQRLDRQEP